MKPECNQKIYIQSFKHDGSLHRTWSMGYVLDVLDNCYVVVTDKTWVIEADGRRWFTKEPAICFFWTDRWYNVISMLRKTGIHYYCNIASPSLYDGEAIKNIDYDLDVKLFPDHTYQILDIDEYSMHASQMHYPEHLQTILTNQMNELLKMMEEKQDPFNDEFIQSYYQKYQNRALKR